MSASMVARQNRTKMDRKTGLRTSLLVLMTNDETPPTAKKLFTKLDRYVQRRNLEEILRNSGWFEFRITAEKMMETPMGVVAQLTIEEEMFHRDMTLEEANRASNVHLKSIYDGLSPDGIFHNGFNPDFAYRGNMIHILKQQGWTCYGVK